MSASPPPRRTTSGMGLVLVAFVVVTFGVNAAVRLPCRDVCGSDVGRDYLDRGIDRSHPPFIDRHFEYPPLIGEVVYAATVPFDHGFRWPFLLNALVLTSLAVATTWMLWRRYGSRTRRWALAPPLWLQGLTNWDLLAVAPATIGLLEWESGRAMLAGALLGAGAAAKLFPALYVPVLVASCAPAGRWHIARRMLVGFVLGAGVFAIPAYVAAPQSFGYFLRFHANRTPSRGSILFFLSRSFSMKPWLSHATDARLSNYVGTIALIAAVVLLVVWTARVRVTPFAACALATIAFMVTNKIYSPQYDMWLVPFLVMLPVRTKLVVHFYVSSTAVWLLTAVTRSLFSDVLGYYVVGFAVVYRLVVLVLLARDLAAMRPLPVPAPVLTLPTAAEASLASPTPESLDH